MVYAVRALVAFFFIPYITSVLGETRYGVWVIVFQTINYFVLLDFGLEKTLVRFISRHLGNDDFDSINQTLNTTFIIYLLAGSAIIVGAWVTSTFLFDFIKVGNTELAAEGKAVLRIIGFYMGVRFYLLPFAGSLGGFHRFDIANGLNIAADIVKALVMVWLLVNGYGLEALAWTIFTVSLLGQAAAIFQLRRLFPQVRTNLRFVNRPTARELLTI